MDTLEKVVDAARVSKAALVATRDNADTAVTDLTKQVAVFVDQLQLALMASAQLRSAVVLMPGEGKLYCVLQWYWPLMASTELLYVHLHSCQDLMSGSPGHKALVFS